MSSTGIIKSAGIVTAGAVLSRLVGFGRETVLAARFGAGALVDAFQNASLLPITMSMPVAGALTSALIPVYARRAAEEGREAALRTSNNLLNIVLVGSLGLALLLALLAPQVGTLVAPGFSAEGRALVAGLTVWLAPTVVFLAISSVAAGILQAEHRFAAPAMAGIPMNGLLIAVILGWSASRGIASAAIGTSVGAAAYMAVHLTALRAAGFRYRFVIDLKDPGLRLVGRLLWPLFITSGAAQLSFSVNRILASGLPEGSISYLNYGLRIGELPLSIFAGALTTVIYPVLSHRATGGGEGFQRALTAGIRMMLFVTAPLTVGMALLREPITRLLFERGAFDAADTAGTAAAILFLTLGIIPSALANVWGKGFYALGDTRSPIIVALSTTAAVIFFSFLLIKPMAHAGLALASSLAQAAALGVSAWLMRRRVGSIGGPGLAVYAAKIGAACALLAAAVLGTDAMMTVAGLFGTRGLLDQALRLSVLIGFGGLVYGLATLLMGIDEAATLLQTITAGWSRAVRRGAVR